VQDKPDNPDFTDAQLIFFAHMLGDGCYVPKQPIHYTSADPENIRMVQEVAKQAFAIEAMIVPQENWEHLYLPSPYRMARGKKHPFTNWLEAQELRLAHSWEKHLSRQLFSCSNRQISLFLHHLWATDGCIHLDAANHTNIYYASTSERLASDVQHLLLRLGVQSTVRKVEQIKKGKTYRSSYHVEVQGSSYQRLFLNLVGCFGRRGRIVPSCLAALPTTANPNADIIDKDIWKTVINPAREVAGKTWRNVQSEMGTQYCGSTIFKSGLSRQRLQAVAQVVQSSALSLLATSDVYWDEIISITPRLIEEVFDATVPDAHNFIANDIIIHNSIEQDADVVMFLYREDYYNKEVETNIMDVLVRKHRNGPTGDAKVLSRLQFSRFDTIDSQHLPPPEPS